MRPCTLTLGPCPGAAAGARSAKACAFVTRDLLLCAFVALLVLTNAIDAAKTTVLLPVLDPRGAEERLALPLIG